MKLERLHEYVLITIVTLMGIALALYSGKLAGSGQADRILIILIGFAVVLFVIQVKANVWLMIPISAGLAGNLAALKLPMGVHDLAILLSFGSFLVFKALKLVRRKPALTFLDFLLLLNLLMLLQAFVRNPTGTNFMGSDRIGGRPYFSVIFALLAYWVLNRAPVSPRHFSIAIKGFLLASGFDAACSALTNHIPSAGGIISKFYDNGSSADATGVGLISPESYSLEEVNRLVYLGPFGGWLLLFLFCKFLPLTVINPVYIGRFSFFLVGIWLLFASGFRSLFFEIGNYFVLSSYFKKGLGRLLPLGLFLCCILISVGFFNGTLFNLPLSAQRVLSFLPGHWNNEAIDSAKGSSEWRYQIWRNEMSGGIFEGNKYIRNKIVGDGFGFDRVLFAQMLSGDAGGFGGNDAMQENFCITGDVHSGPISTIRTVGYVGLILFVVFLCFLARYAWQLIDQAKGTPYFLPALFFGLPLIYKPLGFVFLFGAFNTEFAKVIIGLGMLKLLKFGLDEYKIQIQKLPQQASLTQKQALPHRPGLGRFGSAQLGRDNAQN